MAANRKKILEMLVEERISVEEAYRLLGAAEPETGTDDTTAGDGARTARAKPKYLRVTAQPGPAHEQDEDAERVNVRVPVALIRSGIKFASVLPSGVGHKVGEALRNKGIGLDISNLNPDGLDELIGALSDLEVDVASKQEVVRVFTE